MELAPPRDFDPHILLPRDGDTAELIATKELALLLGLAFNDLKALAWADRQLRKGSPVWEDERNRADPYAGNWIGTLKTFDRLSSGVLHESYKLIRRYACMRVFKTPLFTRALASVPSLYRDAWDRFMRDAEPGSERSNTYHDMLRNTVAYHYSRAGSVMTAGYRAHVGWMPGEPRCDRAWASFGSDMEESRFFFSDAAAVQAQEGIAREAGALSPEDRRRNVRDLSVAIRMVLEKFLEELSAPHGGESRSGSTGHP